MTDPAAEIVADDLLYATGRAIHNRKFNHFKPHIALPYVMELEDETQFVQTEDDIRLIFDRVQEHMRTNNIHEIVRTVVSAEFLDSETVGSTHVSKAFRRDGTAVGAPYPSYSVIIRTNDGGRLARSCVAFLHDATHGSSLIADGVQRFRTHQPRKL